MNKYRKIPIEEIEKHYNILSYGKVIRKSDGTVIKTHINRYGYEVVYFKELLSSFLLHRVILSKFCPNENECCLVVNHKDFNKTNNSIDNLEWMTIAENNKHGSLNSFIKKSKKLEDSTVINIYDDISLGMSYGEIMCKYSITKAVLLNIKYKRSYKTLLSDYKCIKTSKHRHSDIEIYIDEIAKELENGEKPCNIAKKYGISNRAIIDFKNGFTYTNKTPKTDKMIGGEKIRPKDVVDISIYYGNGVSIHELSNKYKLCECSIKNILYGKTWKHIKRKIYNHNQ